MQNLCRLGALVLMLSLPSPDRSQVVSLPQEAHAPRETHVAETVTGSGVFICIASGVLFGAAVLAGNAIAAAGAAVNAINNGCL